MLTLFAQRADWKDRVTQFRTVATGLGFPEGPVVMKDGSVWTVDIRGSSVHRVAPDGKVTTTVVGGGPNGMALGPDGAL